MKFEALESIAKAEWRAFPLITIVKGGGVHDECKTYSFRLPWYRLCV
jgi:hypothetical protein